MFSAQISEGMKLLRELLDAVRELTALLKENQR